MNPIQPFFALSTDHYYKKVINRYGISHIYGFHCQEPLTNLPDVLPDGCIDMCLISRRRSPRRGCAEAYPPRRRPRWSVRAGMIISASASSPAMCLRFCAEICLTSWIMKYL